MYHVKHIHDHTDSDLEGAVIEDNIDLLLPDRSETSVSVSRNLLF